MCKVWCMWILTVPTLLCLFAMVILVVGFFTHELHHCPQVIPARICISYNMPKRYVAGLWTRDPRARSALGGSVHKPQHTD